MNNPLILTTSAAALLISMSAMALSQPASEGPVIDEASITGFGEPATIRVVSNNKESWTNVAKSDLELRIQVRIDMLEGRVRRYIIGPSRWGVTDNSEILNIRVRGAHQVRENHTINASLASLGLNQNDFITRCNNLLSLGRDPFKRHVLSVKIPVRLRTVTRARTSDGDRITRTYSTWGPVPLNIVCAPVRRPTPKITAYSLTIPQNISGACPQDIPMRTRIVANRPSKFRYRLVREDGSTTQFYSAKTERRDGKHIAVGKHIIEIRRPLNTRYRMEIEGVNRPSEWARLNGHV
ncbi:MAG: hypothetical protein ACR2OJ_09375 [Hyphomicrobiales bacterium]